MWKQRKRFENDMDAELRFHLDAYVEDLVRSGIDRTEAERRARVEFGAVEAAKDECRQAWGLQRMDELRADLRLAFRMLRQNPGFATVAIVSLALGIGANTAAFGLADAVLLRVLPVKDPGRLVFVENTGTQGRNGGPPYPCFELLRDKTSSFEGLAAFSPSNMELNIDGAREQVRGVWVSGSFYELLGVRPIAGRTLSDRDDRIVGKGGPDGAVAVISYAYWRQRFGGSASVIGRTLHMNEHPLTIVGIMPSDIMTPEPGRAVDIAVPMMLSDPGALRAQASWWLYVVGRLKPGVRMEQARAEADALFQDYMKGVAIPPDLRKLSFDRIELAPAARGEDNLRKQFATPLAAIMILAGLVLMAACVNVANLMLARATARQKELAVRLAIGAGRGRIVRQALTEAMVLTAAGTALGITLARQAESALVAFFAEGSNVFAVGSNQIMVDLPLNGKMLLFTAIVSALTGLVFGILPALRAARVDPAAGLQGGSRSVAGDRRTLRLGRALVALQAGLSTVLLAGAALFVRSLHQLEAVDRGFTREGLLMMEIGPERQWFGKPEWMATQPEILARVMRLPGVRSAGWATMSPLSGRDRGVILDVPGQPHRPMTERDIHLVSVSPEYFDTLGMRFRTGSKFTAHDDANSLRVAILNETAARYFFRGENPVGRKVSLEGQRGAPVYDVVGVVGDAKHDSLRDEPGRFLYLPLTQSVDRIGRLALTVRTSGDGNALADPVRRVVLGVRPTLLITNVITMQKQVERSLMKERLVSALATVFGGLALALACIGLHGILAYGVTRRTREIGIRMALGATRGATVWLVVREGLALAVCGFVAGVPVVFVFGRVIRAMLFRVGLFDVPAILTAVALLMVFAAVAAIVPARRASCIDPMTALRCE